MERLTEYSDLAGVRIGDLKCGVDERKAFDRLAAYEDTGLEPGNIEDILAAYEAACEELTECRMLREKHAPPCYSPDTSGGCRYQIYSDCNDEPIDKCKRCPLCYADKHRHQQEPPNSPLTLDDLRELDGEPVWVVNSKIKKLDGFHNEWALLSVQRGTAETVGVIYHFDDYGEYWLAYRRKPEEGTA